jgi:hypothetical protein
MTAATLLLQEGQQHQLNDYATLTMAEMPLQQGKQYACTSMATMQLQQGQQCHLNDCEDACTFMMRTKPL